MRSVWSAEGRIALERDYWIAVLRAQKDLGLDIPAEAIEAYEKVKGRSISIRSMSARRSLGTT